MLGVPGTGFYGKIRRLTDEINAHQSHLDAAPLGPIQRKRLERLISGLIAERRAVRQKLRFAKRKGR